MGNSSIKYVKYEAFQFKPLEGAATLKNSKGSKKSRLHLLNYEGLKGQDQYAVAAMKINFTSENDAKLGCFDRRYYVLYKHTESGQWYKINKNSLKKRLGISSKELAVIKTTGVVSAGLTNKLNELAEIKAKPLVNQDNILNEWTAISNAATLFEKNFIKQLANLGIPLLHYKKVVFCGAVGSEKPILTGDPLFLDVNYDPETCNLDTRDIRRYPPGSILLIYYQEKKGIWGKEIPTNYFTKEESSLLKKVTHSCRNPLKILTIYNKNDFETEQRNVITPNILNQIKSSCQKTAQEIFIEDLDTIKTRWNELLVSGYDSGTISFKATTGDVHEYEMENLNDPRLLKNPGVLFDDLLDVAKADINPDLNGSWLTSIQISLKANNEDKEIIYHFIIDQYGVFEKIL